MDKTAKIFVTGHRGMVGSALVRRLRADGYTNLLMRTHSELDLLDQRAVTALLAEQRPDYIFIAAARVGGIQANNVYRADFIYQNLMIEANLIHGAHLAGVQRLMFLGSSCIYPRDCPQPIKEEYLLTGPLEPTNEPYALAKIIGIKLAESYKRQHGRQYVSVMPTNLYGPNDNYDLATSHVLPALIRKAFEARERGETFVTRKITRAIARIALGLQDCLYFGNMSSLRDRGHAKDYVEMQWLMLHQDQREDFVIATGVQYSVRQSVEFAARELGVTVTFSGEGDSEIGTVSQVEGDLASCKVGDVIVKVDPRYYRRSRSKLCSATRARRRPSSAGRRRERGVNSSPKWCRSTTARRSATAPSNVPDTRLTITTNDAATAGTLNPPAAVDPTEQ